MICFFNSSDYLFYQYYIAYLKRIWTGETEDNNSPIGHLVLVSFFIPFLVEQNIQHF